MLFKDSANNSVFPIGVNYWPSKSAINMWSEWDKNELRADIELMQKLGINTCRFFLFMPDFLVKPDFVDPVMIDRLLEFLDLCERMELYSLPTFVVGHMSGEDWDLPWRNGRNIITDPDMVAATKYYITEVVKKTKKSSSIIGWILSNELPNYVKKQSSDSVTNWVMEIIGTIKDIDPERPVSIGDGAWAPEILGERKDFELRYLNRYQDFVGLHFYPRNMDSWRHSFTAAFRLRMAYAWMKPVVVSEFGTSTTLASEENQAHYYRSVMYSSLINNTEGLLSWCLNDFDFQNKRPYSHHPFEERFGLIRTDKTVKPSGYEFNSFNNIVDDLHSNGYKKIEKNGYLVIPSDYYYPYPYKFKTDIGSLYEFYLECFSLLKRANIDLDVVFEPAIELEECHETVKCKELAFDAQGLLYIPRMKFLTKQFWRRITDNVKKGGTLYFSFANDSWVIDWNHIAGVHTDCKFGVPDFQDAEFLAIEVLQDWGEFSKGDSLRIPLQNSNPEQSYCRILDTSSEIIMKDQFDNPFLTKNDLGDGKVYFVSYPIEVLALYSRDGIWKREIGKIYRSIYKDVYPASEISILGDGLEMGIWGNTEKTYKVIILNHSWNEEIGVLSYNRDRLRIVSSSLNFTDLSSNSDTIIFPRKSVCTMEFQVCYNK